MSSPEPSPPVTNTTAPSPNSSSPPAPTSISPPQSTPSAPAPSSPPPTPPSTTALTVSPPPTPTPVTSPALSTSSPPPTSSAPPPSSSSTTVSRSPPPPSSSSANSPPPRPPSRSISSPPSSLSSSSSSGMSTRAVVGIAVGTVVILVAWSLLCIYCTRKKRRRGQYGAGKQYVPPPPGPKDGYNGALAQSWQQNNPPPAENVMPNPSFPPAAPPRPPHSPKHSQTPPLPPCLSSSGGSVSNYSGSEIPLPPTSPGMALGFSKSTFTYEELAMATDGFSDANLLGKGGFGYVHKGIFPNGKQVAVKSLKAGSGQGEPEFQAEVEIISRVHHKHLVSLVGYCMSGSQRMLVYEFVPNNTLEFHLHGKGQPTMDWPTRLKIALGAAKGLAYLHEDCHPKIIHCDIKASNILLDFNLEAKLADFGLAKFSSDANTLISTGVMGTFGYLAPEYASSGKLTDKSDVFSFGVVLMELVTGRQPVDTTQTFMEDSLVDWARPLLTRALEDETFESLVDPCLQNEYNHSDMVRMVSCAASCVRHSARRRPWMNQIVRALEGDMSLSDLSGGIRPGHSTLYGSYGSSDYDSNQYKEDMKGFRKMALASQDFGSGSDHGGTTGEPSGLSSQGQTAQRDGDGKDEERQPRFQRNILQMMLRPSVSGKNAAPSD